jgi:hypothetical protein
VRAWTAQTQTDAFRALRARVYSGRIRLPDDDALVSELCRLRTRLRAGSSLVEVPRSGADHCDSAVALAAAVLELDTRGVAQPLRSASLLLSRNRTNGGRSRHVPRRPGGVLERERLARELERSAAARVIDPDRLGIAYTHADVAAAEHAAFGRHRRSRGFWRGQ